MSYAIPKLYDKDLYRVIELLYQNKEIDAINFIHKYNSYIIFNNDYRNILQIAVECKCKKFLKECHPKDIQTSYNAIINMTDMFINITDIDMLIYLIDNDYMLNNKLTKYYYASYAYRNNKILYNLLINKYQYTDYFDKINKDIFITTKQSYINDQIIKDCIIGIISILIMIFIYIIVILKK